MAVPNPTITDVSGNGNVKLFSWALTTANHTGAAFSWTEWADRTATFTGTWGGATAVLEGSNDGSTWITLADPQGNAISKTADAIEAILEMPVFVRPRLSVVGAGATITVAIACRKQEYR